MSEIIKLDTELLKSYGEQLNQINKSIKSLSNSLSQIASYSGTQGGNSLYSAKSELGVNRTLCACVSYMRETAEEFEKVERTLKKGNATGISGAKDREVLLDIAGEIPFVGGMIVGTARYLNGEFTKSGREGLGVVKDAAKYGGFSKVAKMSKWAKVVVSPLIRYQENIEEYGGDSKNPEVMKETAIETPIALFIGSIPVVTVITDWACEAVVGKDTAELLSDAYISSTRKERGNSFSQTSADIQSGRSLTRAILNN